MANGKAVQVNASGALVEVTATDISPGTTKGDVLVHNGTSLVRLPVGSNNQLLTADSAQTEGIKWGGVPTHTHVSGDVTDFNEAAQDAVGTILVDSSTIDLTYNDGTPSITAAVITDTNVQRIEFVKNSGAITATRKQANFIEGANIAITLADDVGNNQADITIAATGLQPLDDTLTSLAAHNTNGLLTQTAADTFTGRSIVGGTGIVVTNGDGVALNPSIAIDSTVATLTGTQTLTNKSLVDASTSIIDDLDNTKIAKFQASTIATGTTRTFTLPNSDGTFSLVGHTHVSTDVTDFNEASQDAVGAALLDTATVDLVYNDAGNTISANVLGDTSTQRVRVVKNSGAVVGTRPEINFIEGSNVTLTVADDVTNNQVDVTIASAAPGETNTASNVNVGGVGVFKQKTGVNLEFRGVNAASSKVSTVLDATNNEIDIDVVEANLTLGNIGGTLGITKGGTGQTTATAAFNALDPLTTKGDLIVHNGTDSIRVAVGTNTQVLTADSAEVSGVKWAAAGGGSDARIAMSTVTFVNPTVTNNNGNIAIGDGADVTSTNAGGENIAIGHDCNVTAGTRAIVIGADSTVSNSTTICIGREITVIGDFAISIGNNSFVSGTEAIAIGRGLSSDGVQSINIGHSGNSGGSSSIKIGSGNLDNGADNSICIGNISNGGSKNNVLIGKIINAGQGDAGLVKNRVSIGCGAYGSTQGEVGFTTGSFSSSGSTQHTPKVGYVLLWTTTTNATATKLGTNSANDGQTTTPTGEFFIDNNTILAFEAEVVAARTDATNSTQFTVKGLIKRGANAAATALVGTPTKTQDFDDSSGLTTASIVVTADTTNGALKFEGTGIAATNIRWFANVKFTRMGGTF